MLVSWEWLNDYVRLDVSPEELAHRFAMSGLNHEQTFVENGATVLDLEVTSNRGDCLGHIGVAREAAVLLNRQLCIPNPQPKESTTLASSSVQVVNQNSENCTCYTARLIRGVRIGPSPEWLADRLNAIGIKSVNNVVDVTNYVMMECGQPIHAFDFHQIRGNRIIVRRANPDEKFVAIDHKTYTLDEQMVVIADTERAIALGGVMGGADSEISQATTDVLVETALFEPLAIRRAARRLKLQSPSSFRFERRPDPAGVDWASRRCCELILQVAGGQLESGSVAVAEPQPSRPSIVFRLPQISRLLGIEIPDREVRTILENLGCQVEMLTEGSFRVSPPSWRGDLTREVDLIEEVARIHGYDQIPEDVAVPMSIVQPRPKDTALCRVRQTLSAYGIDEAMTPSVVSEKLEACGSLWTSHPPLATETPLLEGARLLRRSILPSLLAARHLNQAQSLKNSRLYEIANVFLPNANSQQLPDELTLLSIVSESDLTFVKGAIQAVFQQIGNADRVVWQSADHSLFEPGCSQRIQFENQTIGWLGIVASHIQKQFDLDSACCAAELDVERLTAMLVEVRRAKPFSLFPAIERDLNFVVDESIRWDSLEETCRSQGGTFLKSVEYRETYRDTKKDGVGKKRVLLSLSFQSMDRTLTGEDVDAAVSRIIAACQRELRAQLMA